MDRKKLSLGTTVSCPLDPSSKSCPRPLVAHWRPQPTSATGNAGSMSHFQGDEGRSVMRERMASPTLRSSSFPSLNLGTGMPRSRSSSFLPAGASGLVRSPASRTAASAPAEVPPIALREDADPQSEGWRVGW